MSRLERDRKLAASLVQEHLSELTTLVEHRRASRSPETTSSTGQRRIRECIAVLVVEEPDGTESLAIVGDAGQLPLSIKGTLHDAIYAMAHKGEPGFEVAEYAERVSS